MMRFWLAGLLCVSFLSRAQENYLLWANVAPAALGDQNIAVSSSDMDNNANSYVIGSYIVTGDQDLFIAKYDRDGNVTWLKTIGFESNFEYGGDITIDKAGDIVITGFLYDPDGEKFGVPLYGAFIAKMDPDGNVVWIRDVPHMRLFTYGERISSGNQSHMEIDSDNSIVLYYDGNSWDFPKPSTDGLYIARYAADGNLIGRYQVTHDDNFDTPVTGGLTIDSNGDFIITGAYHVGIQFGSVILGHPGDQSNEYVHLYVAKISSTGNLIWAKGMDQGLNLGYDVVTDESDNIYLTGIFDSPAIYDNYYVGGSDGFCGFLAMLNSSGQWQATRPFKRASPNFNLAQPYSIKRLAGNEFLITGTSFGGFIFGDQVINRSTNLEQAFVMKLSSGFEPQGIIMSEGESQGYTYRYGVNSTIDNQGNIYTIGNHFNKIVFGCDTLNGGGSNYFFVKHSEFPPLFNITINGPPVVCDAATLQLSATSIPQPVNYLWKLPVGVTNTNTSLPSNELAAQVSEAANYQEVNLSVKKGCYSYESSPYKILIQTSPQETAVDGQQLFCEPVTSRFTSGLVSNASYYVWTFSDGMVAANNSQVTEDPFIDLTITSALNTGTITVRTRNECGDSKESLPLEVKILKKPGVPVLEELPAEVCNRNQVINFKADNQEQADEFIWTISSHFESPHIVSTTTPELPLKVKTAGAATILMFGKNSCHVGEPASVQMIISDPLPPPVVAINQCKTELSVNGGENIQWYHDNLPIAGNVLTAPVASKGEFHVTVSNICGTISSDPLTVNPLLDTELFIPNVITPNGDGKNDVLSFGAQWEGVNLTIFGRWGESVYTSGSYRNDWDGRQLSSGSYYFQMHHQCLEQPYKGWIQIIR